MKLIEVVVLTGAHCISPVQHMGAATEVAKVQCAVVIEKDTQAGTLRIVPAGASGKPEVVAVLERLDGETSIEPAFAPPAQSAPPAAVRQAQVLAPLPQTPPLPEIPAEAARPAAPETAEPVTAQTETAEPPKAAEAPREKAAGKHKCIGEAKPKWYTNAEGRRKYRCVLPG